MRHFLTRFFTCMIVCVLGWSAIAGEVVYHCGLGSGTPPATDTVEEGDFVDEYIISDNTCTPPAGYIFDSWYVYDYPDVILEEEEFYSLSPREVFSEGDIVSDITQYYDGPCSLCDSSYGVVLVAHYEVDKNIGIAAYDCSLNGGSGGGCQFCSGGICELPTNICTPPSGMMLSSWRQAGSNTIYQPGDMVNINNTLEPTMCEGFVGGGSSFYAQYEPAGATYTVTYSCNGGTGTAPSNQTATENQSFTPAANTCSKDGYSFSGWAVSGTNDVKPAGTAFTWEYTENKTFTAQWTGNTVPITWYNGNTQLTVPSNAQSCEYGGTLTLPPEPTPPAPGLIFAGWTIRQLSCTEITDSTTCNNTEGCIYNTYVSACKNYLNYYGACSSIPDTGTCSDYAFGSGVAGCNMLCYSYGGTNCTGGCNGVGN